MDYRKYHGDRFFKHIASAPFIYMMIIPAIGLHAFLEVYHRVCFPLYGLPYVDVNKFIKIDRYKLPYLSPIDKLNCIYCEYVNGLFAYSREVAAKTEEYWCGIKHQEDGTYIQPGYHCKFAEYGDKDDFENKYPLKK